MRVLRKQRMNVQLILLPVLSLCQANVEEVVLTQNSIAKLEEILQLSLFQTGALELKAVQVDEEFEMEEVVGSCQEILTSRITLRVLIKLLHSFLASNHFINFIFHFLARRAYITRFSNRFSNLAGNPAFG